MLGRCATLSSGLALVSRKTDDAEVDIPYSMNSVSLICSVPPHLSITYVRVIPRSPAAIVPTWETMLGVSEQVTAFPRLDAVAFTVVGGHLLMAYLERTVHLLTSLDYVDLLVETVRV